MNRRGEEGFTILELVVALSILAIAIFGIASVFDASIRTSDLDVRRSEAVSLAVQAIDSLRAVPYGQLGLAPTDTAWPDACDPGTTVVRSSAAVYASRTTQSVNGVTYTIDECVVWSQATSGGAPMSYKRITAAVSWTDEGRLTHSVRQDSIVYAGPGPTTTTPTDCNTKLPPSAPPALTITYNGTSSPNSVTLTWATPSTSPQPIDHWIVQYAVGAQIANSYADNAIPAAPGQTNTILIGGLAPLTTYTFTVIGVAPAGPPGTSPCFSSPVSGTQAISGSASGSCRLGLATVTPSIEQRTTTGGQTLLGQFRVAAAALSSCPNLTVLYTPSIGTPQRSAALTLASAGTNQWQTVPDVTSGDPWDLGNHVLTIQSNGTTVGTTQLCVEDQGGSSC